MRVTYTGSIRVYEVKISFIIRLTGTSLPRVSTESRYGSSPIPSFICILSIFVFSPFRVIQIIWTALNINSADFIYAAIH
jgi:hypothetical protein